MGLRRYDMAYLIDDDETCNFIHRLHLTKTESFISIRTFTHPVLALRELQDVLRDGGIVPEVIFVDLEMPGMTGWDFINGLDLLSFSDQNRPQVIILSSLDDADIIDRAHRMPAVLAYVTKPLFPEKIAKVLRKVKSRLT